MAKNPLRAFMDIRRRELPLALLMFGYFFLVITSFWVLKPIKTALFTQFYDQRGLALLGRLFDAAQAEMFAKTLNLLVAFVAVVVFTLLSRTLRRQKLTYAFTGFFLVSYVIYSFTLSETSELAIWTFYLFGDLFSTLMVATFFAFLNDSVTPEMAKRMYGLVGLGGVTGGVFGATFVRVNIDTMPTSGWLWIAFVIGVLIVVIARVASTHAEALAPEGEPARSAEGPEEERGRRGNPALEGARLVFRSRYLLSIVAIVGLYEIASQVMDFQFKSTVSYYLDGDAIGRHYATVYTITNWISLLVQFFLTSFVMTRFGLRTALMVLPLAVLVGSLGFVALPILWVGSLMPMIDNGLSYSINQSSKETLYTPTTREEKYKAKAFIDMFVQRFAKVLAIVVSLVVTSLLVVSEPAGTAPAPTQNARDSLVVEELAAAPADGQGVVSEGEGVQTGELLADSTAAGDREDSPPRGSLVNFSGVRWLSLFTLAILALWLYAVHYAGSRFRELTDGGVVGAPAASSAAPDDGENRP